MIEKFKQKYNITSNFQVLVIFLAFAITGSSTAYIGKLILHELHITKDMGLKFWIPRILIIFALYRIVSLLVGALLGQYAFFKEFHRKSLDKIPFVKNIYKS
ncbi:MAG: diacylglyceryl transferase [Flavobacteriaceae bacterium]|nr:MAG: diacylglyceryl transferase [Flavobacteriaceae bacterium]